MQVHITISGEGSGDVGASTINAALPSPGTSGASSRDAAASGGQTPSGSGGNAINAGSAPSALAFVGGDGSGGGEHHHGASDQSAGPAPQF